jgi:hypothetical protein
MEYTVRVLRKAMRAGRTIARPDISNRGTGETSTVEVNRWQVRKLS